jgi:hypothetical protein
MKLDKKIKDGKKPLTCFDIEEAKKYVDKDCYFASKFENFENLSKVPHATLHNVDDNPVPFQYYDDDGIFCYDCFILPCEWVKPEERYRPFTLKEFVKEYSLGDVIIFKMNSNTKIRHGLFLEYIEDNQEVRLGSYWYGFEELVNNYELYTSKGWKPFGIEE